MTAFAHTSMLLALATVSALTLSEESESPQVVTCPFGWFGRHLSTYDVVKWIKVFFPLGPKCIDLIDFARAVKEVHSLLMIKRPLGSSF